eukprot:TRINITY_DN50852_c0_g2_i1.p1 TRINITY_DN50852_c0_g2~~TRINITY_DN50852_c0_g2_i1.p1  ORF type:complete len:633 (+),score=125.88 TRINITY_DN50852_c0_g2_i1:103-1899(+)
MAGNIAAEAAALKCETADDDSSTTAGAADDERRFSTPDMQRRQRSVEFYQDESDAPPSDDEWSAPRLPPVSQLLLTPSGNVNERRAKAAAEEPAAMPKALPWDAAGAEHLMARQSGPIEGLMEWHPKFGNSIDNLLASPTYADDDAENCAVCSVSRGITHRDHKVPCGVATDEKQSAAAADIELFMRGGGDAARCAAAPTGDLPSPGSRVRTERMRTPLATSVPRDWGRGERLQHREAGGPVGAEAMSSPPTASSPSQPSSHQQQLHEVHPASVGRRSYQPGLTRSPSTDRRSRLAVQSFACSSGAGGGLDVKGLRAVDQASQRRITPEEAAELEVRRKDELKEQAFYERKRVTGAVARSVRYEVDEDPRQDILGLRFSISGRLLVTAMRAGGNADSAGVNDGDQLISIGGKNDFYDPSRCCSQQAAEILARLPCPTTLIFLGFAGKLQPEVRVIQCDRVPCGMPVEAGLYSRSEHALHPALPVQEKVFRVCDAHVFQTPTQSILMSTVVKNKKQPVITHLGEEDAYAEAAEEEVQEDPKPEPKDVCLYELSRKDAESLLMRVLLSTDGGHQRAAASPFSARGSARTALSEDEDCGSL